MKEIIIGSNEAGQRIDRFLCKYMVNSTRTNVYKLIRKKLIKVNGKKTKENYFLLEGDSVKIFLQDSTLEELTGSKVKVKSNVKVDLDIVHEDEDILIVNKPRGQLTHPDKKDDKTSLSTMVLEYLKDNISLTFKPASINRLDRNTSGLVVFCKNYNSLKELNEQSRNREIKKYYQTIVSGKVVDSGEIKGYINKNMETNKVMLKDRKTNEEDLYVETRYKSLEIKMDMTLLEVQLLTGRSHQIRVSLSSIGHPIIGDSKYNAIKYHDNEIKGQLLHAYKIIINDKIYVKNSDEILSYWDAL